MASYTPLRQDDGRSPVPVSRKPVNISLKSTSSQRSNPAPPALTGDRNPTKLPLRSNSLHSEFETITIQKDKFRKLVEALAASVQLLQEGVGSVRPQEALDPELGVGNNQERINGSMQELSCEFLGIKKHTSDLMKHADEILDRVFNQGHSLPCYCQFRVNRFQVMALHSSMSTTRTMIRNLSRKAPCWCHLLCRFNADSNYGASSGKCFSVK
jgi:hypothetical protein